MWKKSIKHIEIIIDDNDDDEQGIRTILGEKELAECQKMNYAARSSYSHYATTSITLPLKPISTETSNLTSLLTQSSLAPLVSFDEDGDIPVPTVVRSSSAQPSNLRQNNLSDYCCSWNRFRSDFCHVFCRFLFSQVGLSILVFVYVALGGLIFNAIESRYEAKKNEQIKREHTRGIEHIRHIATDEFNWKLNVSFETLYARWRGMISRHESIDKGDWRVFVDSTRFDKLIDDALAQMQSEQEKLLDKHDARSDVAYNQKWTFSTAMLYSATVITTVGYGNIAPKSILGKVMTCAYALFGIPIMIMCLTNTGDLLAFLFIKYYSLGINFAQRKIQEYRHRRQGTKAPPETNNKPVEHVPVAATVGVLALYIVAGAVLFSAWEGWSYVDGAYFSFITFTTIGLGDLVPGKGTLTDNKNGKSIFCAMYLLFGLVLTAMCFKLMQDDLFAAKQRLFARLGLENTNHHHDNQELEIREPMKQNFSK